VETSNEPRTDLLVRLAAELTPLIEFAGQHNLTLAFEPEPGMLISTLDDFADLLAVLNQSGIELSPLGLTLDVVHLHCQGETPIADRITQWSDRLANVHLADAPAGRHEHLMFGEGSIQFAPVLATLEKLPSVPGCVELSRHSHMAVDAIRDAFSFVSGASRGFDSGGKASR
jgi:sugar phosphate isomerase/epimerase